jgi:hypothetical protein
MIETVVYYLGYVILMMITMADDAKYRIEDD